MIAIQNDYASKGVRLVLINSNDTDGYPDDSYENMQRWAKEKNFPFPYLIDPSQEIGHRYGAVCTPDFFGFNAKDELQYRGRLDEGRKDPVGDDAPRELYDAMRLIAHFGYGPGEQHPSMGCSIKWREPEPAIDLAWQPAM